MAKKKTNPKKGQFEISDKRKNELTNLKEMIENKKHTDKVEKKKKNKYTRILKRVSSNPIIHTEMPMAKNFFPDSKSVDYGFEYIPEIPNQEFYKDELPEKPDLTFSKSVADLLPAGGSTSALSFLKSTDPDSKDLAMLDAVEDQDGIDFLKNRLGDKSMDDILLNMDTFDDGLSDIEEPPKSNRGCMICIIIFFICVLITGAVYYYMFYGKAELPSSTSISTSTAYSTISQFSSTISSVSHTTTIPSILITQSTTTPTTSTTTTTTTTTIPLTTKAPEAGTCSSDPTLSADDIKNCINTGIETHVTDPILVAQKNHSYTAKVELFTLFNESVTDDITHAPAVAQRTFADAFKYLGVKPYGAVTDMIKAGVWLKRTHWVVEVRLFINMKDNINKLLWYRVRSSVQFQIHWGTLMAGVLRLRYGVQLNWRYAYFEYSFLDECYDLLNSPIERPASHVPELWKDCIVPDDCFPGILMTEADVYVHEAEHGCASTCVYPHNN